MIVAYLVLAHRHPELLSRLIHQLQSPASDIFVHIDAQADIAPFLQATGSDAHFTARRIPVYWGDYSLIRAALVLMEEALAAPRRYDYLVLISGADYPLRSATEIENFFRGNKGGEFIDSVAMPSTAAAKPLSRLTIYRGRPGPLGWCIGKSRRLLGALGLMPNARDYKKYFGELVPHAGNQWWALTRDACVYIQKFAADNPRIMKFYENTYIPDEMLFQPCELAVSFKHAAQCHLFGLERGRGKPGGDRRAPHRDVSRQPAYEDRWHLRPRRIVVLPQGHGHRHRGPACCHDPAAEFRQMTRSCRIACT
jgi:hypothetical protein